MNVNPTTKPIIPSLSRTGVSKEGGRVNGGGQVPYQLGIKVEDHRQREEWAAEGKCGKSGGNEILHNNNLRIKIYMSIPPSQRPHLTGGKKCSSRADIRASRAGLF